MPKFVVDRPIETAEPRVVVEGGLDAGSHRFQLEVVTADGRRSAPMLFALKVVKPLTPDDGFVVVNPLLVGLHPPIRPRQGQPGPVPPRPIQPRPAPPRPTPIDPRPAPIDTRPGPIDPRPTPAQPRPGPAPLRPDATVRPATPATPTPADPATPGRRRRQIRRPPGRGDNNPTE